MAIKKLMGNASVATTMGYMRVGEDYKRRAMPEAAGKWQQNRAAIVTEAILANRVKIVIY